ncbi:DEAD/DEAH box helicase [Saccharicrinis aurantiacus]|uniref:DEAD/DEAH box helicase n=1 Tax=Saccharicrinis aurantiacus TaxID=1849719 RepID=UPI0024921F3D|nr:DEAD/DEAH box helicase [Saccharicrinis aurantiacus]
MDHFIVVLTENRNLGIIASAYFAEDNEGSPSLVLKEKVNTHSPEQHKKFTFTPEQLTVLAILDQITDRYLFNEFSKDTSIKQFYEKLDDQKLEDTIRPHIEAQMMACLNVLAQNPSIKIYLKDKKYSNIYKSDRLEIYPQKVDPIFYFKLDEKGINYTLKIKTETEDVSLTYKKPIVISHSPCILLIREKLYRFENTDSKKFVPFFEKSSVQIQARSVATYMKTFVAASVKNHAVNAEGFDIVAEDIKPVAKLVIAYNLQQEPILTLEFVYGTKSHLANSKSNVVVDVKEANEKYTLIKYKRDDDWEQLIIKKLLGLGLLSLEGHAYYPKGYEQPYEFYPIINWYNLNRTTLNELDVSLSDKSLDKEYYFGESSCVLNTSKDGDWYDLQMIIKIGIYDIPFLKFRKYIIAGKKEYELPDGKIFVIPEEWYSKYGDILTYAEEFGNKLRLKPIFHHLTGKKNNTNAEVLIQQNSTTVPATLKASLRPYQQQGFSWMNYLNNNGYGGILADDMGLGKTLQTITLLLNIYKPSEHNPDNTHPISEGIEGFNTSNIAASLIVMPTSLIHNWLNEFRKFAPSLKVYVYSGQKRLRSKEIGNIIRHYHVVLSSYGVIRNDIEYIKHYNFEYFILDESQYIKNPTSKIYQAVSQVECNKKLVLTGTPIENSLTDLWAQMNFVNEGLLGSLPFFKKQFVHTIEKLNNEGQKEKLQQLIAPYILRRTKEKVAKELPPVSEQVLLCDMTPEQQKVYEVEKSGIRNQLLKTFASEGIEKSTFLALQGLTKLRQIANHPKLVDEEYTGSSGKYNLILDHLNSIINEGHKVLIFSSFVKDLELIETQITKDKINYSKLTGSTTNRQKVVENFEHDDNCKVFLISLKAGGVGLNLISADYVFLLNPWWNPAAESQAINRAHRIGQTKNVFVYRFISVGSIEEKIMRLQEHKSELANTFINSNNPFKNMGESEIKELFS